MKKVLPLLLCLLTVLSLFTGLDVLAAGSTDSGADLAGTGYYLGGSETSPWLIDNWDGLKNSFLVHPDDGDIVYLKLKSDITYSGAEQGTLETHGFDVVLDLGGYTLKCVDKSNNSFHFIHASNGTVTIKDSRRYDEAKDKWYSGTIDYLYDFHYPDRDTAVMSGDIIIKGGKIVNRTHSNYGDVHCVYTNNGVYSKGTHIDNNYYDGCIKIYDGTLEADHPLFLGYLPGSGIYGGTLNAKSSPAVWIEKGKSDTAVYSSENIPELVECRINNATDDDAISSFQLYFPSAYSSNHTADQALSVFLDSFGDSSYAYIDGKRPYNLADEIPHTNAMINGPTVKSNLYIVKPEIVSKVELTITEPEPGDEMSFTASTPSRAGYTVGARQLVSSSDWDVQWTDADDVNHVYERGSVFEADKSYEVFIRFRNSDSRKYTFADESSLTVTINGKNALIYSTDNGYVAYRRFEVKRKKIEEIALTVTEPRIDASPVYSASKPSDADYAVDTSYNTAGFRLGVAWTKGAANLADGAKFEADQSYSVLVSVIPVNTVKYEFTDPENITATVNGRAANVIKISAFRYSVWYTFDLSATITDIAVTIPEPIEGEQIQWTASSTDPAYVIQNSNGIEFTNGVKWEKIDGKDATVLKSNKVNYFEAEATYRVTISVNPAEGYQFAERDSQTFKVNDNTADCTGYTAKVRMVKCTFTVKHAIKNIDITIPAPTPGEELSYDPVLPEGANYRTSGVTGAMWKNGMEWNVGSTHLTVADHPVAQEGVTYKAVFVVTPTDKENYQFAPLDKITTTVNGSTDVKLWKSSSATYYISYTFAPPAEITIVDSVDLTITAPEAEKALSYDAVVINGVGCRVQKYDSDNIFKNGVVWSDSYDFNHQYQVGTKAHAGMNYGVCIWIELTDSAKYQFAENEDFNATVNGWHAFANKINDTTYSIAMLFSVPKNGCLLGDSDTDGEVSILDATYIQRYLAELPIDKFDSDAADADEDGEVTILDATAIQRHLAGLPANERIGTLI